MLYNISFDSFLLRTFFRKAFCRYLYIFRRRCFSICCPQIINTFVTCYPADPSFVIVPINYKEYDREMSKAYAQPFKKQAWRLFQNNSTGFDVQSELIPLWNISEELDDATPAINAAYRIRYVKRPDPIVLANLPNGLTIDGFNSVTECTLNPIVHMDILNKAVEIALSTRGRVSVPSNRQQD